MSEFKQPRVRERVIKSPGNPDSAQPEKTGYKKPPIHSRFKKGQSGNPYGRPKKATFALEDALLEAFSKKVRMNVGGVVKDVSFTEAFSAMFVNKALKGEKYYVELTKTYLEKFADREERQLDRHGRAPHQQLARAMLELFEAKQALQDAEVSATNDSKPQAK